jgi:hypothetical protein
MIWCQLVVFDLLMSKNELFNRFFELKFEGIAGVQVVGKEEGIPLIVGEDVRKERLELALLTLLLSSAFLAALVYPWGCRGWIIFLNFQTEEQVGAAACLVSNIKREVGVSRPEVVLNQGGDNFWLVSLLDDHLLTSFLLQQLGAFGYLFLHLWSKGKHVIFLKLFLALLVLVLIYIPALNLVVLILRELSTLPDFLYRVVLLL